MLEQAAAGRLDVIFLLGADPISDCPDKDLAVRALQTARFVVAIDAFVSPSTACADVVLPAAIYTERRGSFTNLEGRLTWLGQKVTAPGTARPDWMIAVELASRLGTDLGATSLEELWAEIERISSLHVGVSQALLMSRQGRNGVVVPRGLEVDASELAEVPPPLDPMADPGITSAELHPAPPVSLSIAGGGGGRTNAPAARAEDFQSQGGAAAAGPGATGDAPGTTPAAATGGAGAVPPPMLRMSTVRVPMAAPAGVASIAPGSGDGAPLRLVASRPMWDGGVLVQRSPSLAALHPPLVLALNPYDLARLGAGPAGQVRARTKRGSLVVAAVADPRVPVGVAVLPFNLPGGGAGALIDASRPYTELTVEGVP